MSEEDDVVNKIVAAIQAWTTSHVTGSIGSLSVTSAGRDTLYEALRNSRNPGGSGSGTGGGG